MSKEIKIPKYNFKSIEKKWQKIWEKEKINEPNLAKAKKPFYNLMMFPYPSAEGLHVGSVYTFTGVDTYGRYKKLQGYDVFEPIGLDGFGIHSENYAIKIGQHIKDVSKRTEKNFYRQLHAIGNMYSWDHALETYDPKYYKWTQWLFLKMFEKGLAYRKKAKVNWCPKCKTVISDEQVIAERCERCETQVGKKDLEQWFFKITEYAERLLKNLDWIDWPEDIKTNQRNWIGKSEGAKIRFKILELKTKNNNLENYFEVFTTRPDTLFGATYMVLAPEHPLISNYESSITNRKEVKNYIEKARNKSEQERRDDSNKKTGVELKGLKAVNPATQTAIPIWVADYVLGGYGTGAIMAVPAHDQRDYEFAKKYDLAIKEVVLSKNIKDNISECFTGEGTVVNSNFLNDLDTAEAKKQIVKWLKENKLGEKSIDFKLRDWCISRQRYWGPPIPIIWCKACGEKDGLEGPKAVAVPEKDLPVKLPPMQDFLPEGTGKGPLAKNKNFVKTICPVCSGPAERETDVSDPFVDSAWYFFRYPSTEFDQVPFEKKRTKKWLPVDSYIGGKEHTVLHLLYSRFVTMVLKDLGYIDFEEPYKRFFGHGLITKDGAKMSKSKGNVVNPDEMLFKYGADTTRLYLRFLGDFSCGGDWRDSGVEGMFKFTHRFWTIFHELQGIGHGVKNISMIDKTIKVIGQDLERLSFNTAVARLMEFVNWIRDNADDFDAKQAKKIKEILCFMISPMAPHIAEELWSFLGHKKSIFTERWPKFDEKNLITEEIEIIVQINGKLRDKIIVSKNAKPSQIESLAKKSQKIQKHLQGEKIKKVVLVPGRLISFVI